MLNHTTKTIRRSILAAGILAFTSASHAALVIQFNQVGANVVETGSGSANTAGLGAPSGVLGSGLTDPSSGLAFVGPTGVNAPLFLYPSGISGPASIGAGVYTAGSSGSGDTFGINGNFHALYVPFAYVSGSALNGTTTFNGQTFASLGLNIGTFTYTWGSGANADSATVYVGVAPAGAAVPEPGSAIAGLLALGVCFSGLVKRNRTAKA